MSKLPSNKSMLEKLCTSLGKNNDAAYAVVAVAVAKGIFRPLFTMMDKEQDPETKKYTAMREGLTEVVAIPCYLGVAWTARNVIAKYLFKGKPETEMIKGAKTLSFLGVCTAALIIIPATCSAILTPIMEKLKKPTNKTNTIQALDIKEEPIQLAASPISYNAMPQTLPKSYNAFNIISYNQPLRIGGGQS